MALDKLTKVQSVGISSFIQVVGVVTATGGFVGDLTGNVTGNITGTTSNASGATGDFSIADKIVHTGDTNTALRFPAADTITAETAGSERLRITSAGLIGIGTVSPSGPIHAHAASGTQRSYLEASAAHSFLRLKSGSTSYNSGVEFFSGASNIANINGLGAGGLQFEVNATERLRITSNGMVRVHDSASLTFGNNDDMRIFHDGGSANYIDVYNKDLYIRCNRDSGITGGDIVLQPKSGENSAIFRDDGAVELYYDNVKRFETQSTGFKLTGRFYINGSNGAIDYNNTAHTLEYIVNGSAHSELNNGAYVPAGTKNLGSNAARWQTLYVSNGIDFSANSNASGMTSEVLDDYEEGTWTPAISGTSTDNSGGYSRYTKIGNRVFFQTHLVLNGNPGDTFTISGLPFSSSSVSRSATTIVIQDASNSYAQVSGQTATVSDSVTIIGCDMHGTITLASGDRINLFGTYIV